MKYVFLIILLFILIQGEKNDLSAQSISAKEFLYVGTFSIRGSEGIYLFSFDRAHGKFTKIGTVHSLNDPTFLEISSDKNYLYSVNRQSVDTLKNIGSVTSFQINKQTGLLSELSRSSSFGNSPCHVNVSSDGKWVFASHYKDGSLTALSVDDAGKITGLSDSVIHRGSSINKQRQETAHAHSMNFVPGTNYFMLADLGSDKLWVYQWINGIIKKAPLSFIPSTPGSGPRHFTFFKGKPWLYVAEELSSTVSVYNVDVKKMTAKPVQQISTLPDTFTQMSSAADIHLSPDQKFLYVSNRGHNSLAIYKVNSETGNLTLVGHQSTLGKTPRNFYMDVKGEFVLVANQDSDDIFFFTRNKKTGLLLETGERLQVPSPVCLKMVDF